MYINFCLTNHLISDSHAVWVSSSAFNYKYDTSLFYPSDTFLYLQSFPSVCGFFLDLWKAFDSVPHLSLIELLLTLNFPSILVNWLHSYLLNHTQSVILSGHSSPPLPASSGVPQGSILGPLLFLSTSMEYLISIYLQTLTLSCMLMTYLFSNHFHLPQISPSSKLTSTWSLPISPLNFLHLTQPNVNVFLLQALPLYRLKPL